MKLKALPYFRAMKRWNWVFLVGSRLSAFKEGNLSAIITKIAAIATGVSVAVMIIATCLISGFRETISEKVFGFWGHIQVLHNSSLNSYESAPLIISNEMRDKLNNTKAVNYIFEGESFKTKGGIKHVQSYLFKPGIIGSKTQIEGILLKGLGKDFSWPLLEPFIKSGNRLDLNSEDPAREIILSEQTANRLQVTIGNSILLHFVQEGSQISRKLKVKGIFRTGLEEYDTKFALVDMRFLQELQGWNQNQITGLEIILEDQADMEIMAAYLYENVLSDSLYTETIRQKLPNIFEWLELQTTNEQVINLLMILVAIVNMSTALLILIVERTNMVGILKALGSSNNNIQVLFMFFAGRILLWGLLLGNAIGLGLCYLEDKFKFIKLPEKDYYLSYAPVSFDWGKIALINGQTLLITLIVLIIPSFMVRRLTPVNAMKWK